MHTSRVTKVIAAAILTSLPCSAQTVVSLDTQLLGVDDAKLTPDGQLVLARDNTMQTRAICYDAMSGTRLWDYNGPGALSGAVQDGVAVTNDRGVVIGSACMIFDLTNLVTPLLTETQVGNAARDLAITPDETLVAVRGGSGTQGGLYVFELATGAQVAFAPGQPRQWSFSQEDLDVDSVAVTDDHVIFTSQVGVIGIEQTRVTILDLHPSGGGPPAVVFESFGPNDLLGMPFDVAITPDGLHATVRSELAIGLYKLDGANSTMLWGERLFGNPGPFGLSAMDAVEVTNDRIATISRWSNGGIGAQVDIFDIAGVQKYERIDGDPHDLKITPNGERLIVRTHTHVYMYDLVNLPGGQVLSYMDRHPVLSTHTSYGAGVDSVEVTNDKAVTFARSDESTRIRFFDISGPTLVQVHNQPMPERPIDLTITPSESKAIVTGWSRVMVFDLLTYDLLLDYDAYPTGGYPWAEGVVANDSRAVAFGYRFNLPPFAQGGWLAVVDLFDSPSNYCSTLPNSTGESAFIYATGSASVSANDLRVVTQNVPAGELGAYVYGDMQMNSPFADGFRCVGGQAWIFNTQMIPASGFAELDVDNTNLPSGGAAITAGSTWNFQFMHRDGASTGTGTNLSDGLEILFEL